MQTYRIEKTLETDGTLTLNELPFHQGDRVEVVVAASPRPAETQDRYPLRGTPIHYHQPTEPVADGDWETSQ